MTRPRWHAAARYLGDSPWVPFEIADALQRQVDALGERWEIAQGEQSEQQAALRATRVEVERLREHNEALERALEDARMAAEMAEMAAQPSAAAAAAPETAAEDLERLQARLRELEGDVERAHRQRDEAIERGRREERIARLDGIGHLHDGVRRSLEASPGEGPWAEGQRGLLKLVEDEVRRAGAEPFGAEGELFDPSLHEAIAVVPGSPPGTIATVVKSGFRLMDGTLVRPASVVVTADAEASG